MPSPQSAQIGHQKSHHIPTYLPLPDAAKKYGLSEKVLTQLIQVGKIQAVRLPTGELLVDADNNGYDWLKTKEEFISKKFTHLRGQRISAHAAQEKYGVHHTNFIRWARAGFIQIIHEEKQLMEMDEAGVAYCAYIYHKKKEEYGGKVAGVRLFDDIGNPYEVKYPDLSVKRRK